VAVPRWRVQGSPPPLPLEKLTIHASLKASPDTTISNFKAGKYNKKKLINAIKL